MLGVYQLVTSEEGEAAPHEVREGMCCFATEKDRVQESGLTGGRRRGKTSQQNKKAGATEKLLEVSGKNDPREEDTIINDVFLPPHLSSHQFSRICLQMLWFNW